MDTSFQTRTLPSQATGNMNRDLELEADLDVIRGLIHKWGPRFFNILVDVAVNARESVPIPGLRDSTVSSARSFVSTATSNSRGGTSSSLSFYTDPGPPGPIVRNSGMKQSRPPMGMPQRGNVSGTSTPVDLYEPSLPGLSPSAMSMSHPRETELEASGDGGKSKLQCPFCTEFGIDMRIGRKPDLKRHFHKIHATNAQWICKNGGCNLSFDFHSAYEKHVKQDHGGLKDPDAKVNLCQQVVFACGFERCREVFEAPTDQDGLATMNQYFDHILTHVASSSASYGTWSYSRRIRNLLHQKHVHNAWKDCDKDSGEQLAWLPQSSSIMRKMLECRHLVDVAILCKYAVLLGSGRHAPAIPPNGFVMPTLNDCTVVWHDPRHDQRFATTPAPLPRKVARRRTDEYHAAPPAPVLRSSHAELAFSYAEQQPALFCQDMLDPMASGITSAPSFPMSHPTSFAIGSSGSDDTVMPEFPDSHPLSLYTAFESLGHPPTQNQVMGMHDNGIDLNDLKVEKTCARRNVFGKIRGRRNSSPGSDCRMAENPPPQTPLPQIPTNFTNQHQLARRRSSGAMDTDFFAGDMTS